MKRYIRAARSDIYFGKSERDLFGELISKTCSRWIISKRVYHLDEGAEISLQAVADLLAKEYPDQCGGTYIITFGNDSQTEEFDLYAVLAALEGMCYNDEAVEVADGFYYVGSYADWQKDAGSQEELEGILSEEGR